MKTLTCFSLLTLIIGSLSLNRCKKDDPVNHGDIIGVVMVAGTPSGSSVAGTIGPPGYINHA